MMMSDVTLASILEGAIMEDVVTLSMTMSNEHLSRPGLTGETDCEH